MRRYVVFAIYPWSSLSVNNDGKSVRQEDPLTIGFLPAFATRDDAEAWRAEADQMSANIVEVETVDVAANVDDARDEGRAG